jgi:dihydrofolate reductase
MKGAEKSKTTIISENVAAEVEKLKNKNGKNIIIFGSPSAAHSLMEHNLIDEYWLFINPIIIGQGIPMFAKVKDKLNLQLMTNKVFTCGVTALHYTVVR